MKTKNKIEKQLNWNLEKSDLPFLLRIADRAMLEDLAWSDRQSFIMDIEACHLNGTPLDLERLSLAEGFDFAHDVFGIQKHINRRTGELENCFLPRCARKSDVAVAA